MTPDQVNQFFSYLHHGTLGDIVYWLEFLASILTATLFAALFVITVKFRQVLKPKIRVPKVPVLYTPSPALIAGPWEEVQKKIASSYPSDWNLAVIQADSIFDVVLKDMSLGGTTLGDRLKQLDFAKLNSLNDVWEAHKIRNRIAHEADHVLSHDEAHRAVTLFEKGLRELQFLQDE